MSVIERFTAFYQDLASMQTDELGSLYSKDVVFIDPIATHAGLSAVQQYFDNLLESAKHCVFTIHTVNELVEPNEGGNHAYQVQWQMVFSSKRLNHGKPIEVDGITVIRTLDDKIHYHRDYYDLGQMIYEHVPLVGRLIKTIKKGLR